MNKPPQGRAHRKVLMATEQDIHRLDLLRTLVEQDVLFTTHPVHDAELLRGALAFTASHLTQETPSLKHQILRHIAAERDVSQQVHAAQMQRAKQRRLRRQASLAETANE